MTPAGVPKEEGPERLEEHAPRIGIVILNWNGWRDTMEAVGSARALTYVNHRIYVVDNASTDGSEEKLRAWDPTLNVIPSGGNLGWAGGNNAGIRAALRDGCVHVLLLNNDAVLRPDSLTPLAAAAQSLPRAASAGSVIVDWRDPGRVEFGGCFIDPRTHMPRHIHGRLDTLDLPRTPVPMPAVKGCAMLLTGTGLARTGLLTEDYFLNFDEIDWCFRARAAGLEHYLVARSIVGHKGAASFEGTESPLYRYFMTRNRLVFARRHLDRTGRWYAWRGASWDLRQVLAGPKPDGPWSRSTLALAVLRAAADYLLGRLGDCPSFIRTWNSRR